MTTGWVSQRDLLTGSLGSQQIPQYIRDLIGDVDPNQYRWDPDTMSLVDRYTGGSYSYANVPNPANGTQVVTDLSAYNASGGQQGAINYGAGQNPYFGFGDSAQGYAGGDAPNSGMFVSADPNAISDYQSHASDVVNRGVASVGAVTGGMVGLGHLLGPMSAAGTAGAATPATSAAVAADGLTPITVGASALPGGVPSVNAASASAWGAGVPSVASGSVPSIARNGAALTGATDVLSQSQVTPPSNQEVMGGNWLTNLLSNPMVLSSLLSGGGALLGGAIQGDAAGEAVDLAREQDALNREQQQPYIQGGYAANQRLADLLGLTEGGSGDLVRPFDAELFEQYKDPGYDFRLEQGRRGVLNSAAANSGALTGSAMKDLLTFNQDLASTEYSNAFNRYQTQQGNIFGRLNSLLTLGQNAAAGVGATGANLAGTASQALQTQGGAYGGGVVGAGNSAGQGLVNHWLFNTDAGRATWGNT